MIYEKQNETVKTENVFAGIVGAFLFSLVGGLVWFLFYLIGFFSGFSGLIGVILAIKGYQLFAKKESVKGIIISSVIAFLVLVLAWYLCFGKDIYDAFQEWYKAGEVDTTLTYFESLRAVPAFLTDSEVGPQYIKDLIIGLVFALIGALGTIITSIKNIKAKQALLNSENTNTASEEIKTDPAEPTAPLRSALTDEKVRELLKTNVFGHEVVFRRVAKTREELVIDGTVYAEYALTAKVQFPYEMHAFFDGHYFEAGYGTGYGNYISVDKVVIAKKFRW